MGLVYLGTYTEAGGRGLVVADADELGSLTINDAVAEIPQPSFLTVAPDGRHLYAVSEVEDGQVFAVAIGDSGELRVLGHQPTHGGAPAHLSVHPSGRYLLSANYFGGNIAVHPIGPDGELGPATDVVTHEGSGPKPDQSTPHPHQIRADPQGRFVLVVDLGTDTVYVYRLDLDSGRLHQHSTARLQPGTGPRHLAFHPDGHTMYVLGELGSTVTVCAYDQGQVRPGQVVSTLPEGTSVHNQCGEILVAPDGRYVYASNRGHDSIAVLATDGQELRLVDTVPCGGHWPRDMAFANDGRLLYVANERADLVTAFRVDCARLTPTGTPLSTPAPVCVLPRY